MLEAGIVTATAEELLAFYRQGLGFELNATHEFPQGIVHRLHRDGAGLKLFQPVDGARAHPRPEPWHRDAGFGYAALHVDDVDRVFGEATAAGATAVTPPTSHRPGARYALIADPQGNVWELLEEQR